MLHPNSDGQTEESYFLEAWSAAARAAAAASRGSRGAAIKRTGSLKAARVDSPWILAGRKAYAKAGGRLNVNKALARKAVSAMKSHDRDAQLPRNEQRWKRTSIYKKMKRQLST